MSEVRYIIYAEEEEGGWRPYLQMAHVGGEHDGQVYWMDPGKQVYKTEAEALAAGKELATFGPDANVDLKLFEPPKTTDIRLAKIELAIKGGVSIETAQATELARVADAKAAEAAEKLEAEK